MARFLRKARRRRCYFCHQAEASEAYYTNVCPYHDRQIRAQARARRQSLHPSTSTGPRLADVGPVAVTGEKGGVKGGVKASSIGL